MAGATTLPVAATASEPIATIETPAASPTEAELFAPVAKLLQARCAMPACHAGPQARLGLRLDARNLYRTAVNVRSRSDSRYLRIDPGAPDRSLLLLKLLNPGEGHYRGPRMPLSMDPLNDREISLVRSWIASFPASLWGPPAAPERVAPMRRAFQGRYLASLPTTESLGAGNLEFRIVHRFKGAVSDSGSKDLWGLDTGAWISLELGYGLSDTLSVGLRRTNQQQDYEAYLAWSMIRQRSRGAPLSLAWRGGAANARQQGIQNRARQYLQAILSRTIRSRVSLMLVPTYVTHTNSIDPTDRRGTQAIGAGVEWHIRPTLALIGDYVVQTGGVEAHYQGGSVGLSISTAGHVFQVILTNTSGIQTDLYAPGGDLDFGGGDYRLGFNISRTWSLRR
jgi:Membrane bound beta barrel domain (DUF5777)